MKSIKYILLIGVLVVFSSCFKDKGNYDYIDVNEVIIGASGFDGEVYNLRANTDRLTIAAKLQYTQDPNMSHTYEYQWVAVGKTKNPGKRFAIGDQPNLSYEVKLPADSYDLYLKVKDLTTELTFSRGTLLNVSTAYTKGWLVAAEDAQGNAVVDMISISRDTLIQKNVAKDDRPQKTACDIWTDNNTYSTHDRVYLSTSEGTIMYDRETMSRDQLSNMLDYFANKQYVNKAIASYMNQIDDKTRLFVVDGHAYKFSISGANSGFFGTPINRYNGEYNMFKVSDRVALNFSGSGPSAVTRAMLYNDDKKCFCYVNNFDEFATDNVDSESDQAIYSWHTGLDYVTTINSMFAGGQSATILKDKDDKYYIYTYTVSRGGYIKGARYRVSGATDFDKATHYMMSSRQGYMIYSVGSVLYGYDFRGANGLVTLHDFSPRVITDLHNDIFTSEKNDDYLYVATYLPANEQSGLILKYGVTDSADKIEIVRQQQVSWSGLNKVKSIWFKEF